MTDKKNDTDPNKGKREIMKTEEAFIFKNRDMEVLDQMSSEIGPGITALNISHSKLIGEIRFDISSWTFDDVVIFLRELGFEVSDAQQVNADQITFKAEEDHMLMLESFETEVIEHVVMKSKKGINLTRIKAKAITPGTHKGFKFTKSSVDSIGDLYEGQNIILNHKFEKPGDVIGFIPLKGEDSDDGPLVEGFIHGRDAQERVKNGELHSVSSGLLLRADKNKVVTKVMKVVELTLTGRPADENAVITEVSETELPLTNQRIFTVPEFGADIMNEQKKQTEQQSPLTLTLEQRMADMEKQNVQLQLDNAQLQEQQKLDRNNIESMAKNQKQELAFKKAEELVRLGKILPSQQPVVEAMYASFTTEEQEQLFHQFMKAQQNQIDLTNRGQSLQEQPIMAHPIEQALFEEARLDQQANDAWKAMGLDGPNEQKPYLQQRGRAGGVAAFGPHVQQQTQLAQQRPVYPQQVQQQYAQQVPPGYNPPAPSAPVAQNQPMMPQALPLTEEPPMPEGTFNYDPRTEKKTVPEGNK